MSATALRVHVVRHGRVDAHRGDAPVTQDGLLQAEEAGLRLAHELQAGEIVHFLHAPTRRTRETVEAIRRGMEAALGPSAPTPLSPKGHGGVRIAPPPFEGEGQGGRGRQAHLLPAAESWALRNPDLYVAGARVEMVSTAEAMAEQIPGSGLGPDELARLPFLHGFWTNPDRIGHWVGHPDPPGEDATTVAQRLLRFAASLLDLPREQPRRCICVTHSGPMRALLRRYLLHDDPGEPEWVESVDLIFAGDQEVTIRYRDRQATMALPCSPHGRTAR
jgi:broad specificity phosphatase PhoE